MQMKKGYCSLIFEWNTSWKIEIVLNKIIRIFLPELKDSLWVEICIWIMALKIILYILYQLMSCSKAKFGWALVSFQLWVHKKQD